jgi:hypothetical protein
VLARANVRKETRFALKNAGKLAPANREKLRMENDLSRCWYSNFENESWKRIGHLINTARTPVPVRTNPLLRNSPPSADPLGILLADLSPPSFSSLETNPCADWATFLAGKEALTHPLRADGYGLTVWFSFPGAFRRAGLSWNPNSSCLIGGGGGALCRLQV